MGEFDELAVRLIDSMHQNGWNDEIVTLTADIAAAFDKDMDAILEYCIMLAGKMPLYEYSTVLSRSQTSSNCFISTSRDMPYQTAGSVIPERIHFQCNAFFLCKLVDMPQMLRVVHAVYKNFPRHPAEQYACRFANAGLYKVDIRQAKCP